MTREGRRLHLAPTGTGEPLDQARAAAAVQQMLWTPRELSRWGAVVGLSAVVLTGAWYSVSGKTLWDDQLTGINVGAFALVASYLAGVSLLVSGRRAVGVRRVALLGDPGPVRAQAATVAAPTADASGVQLVGGEGLFHYHRSDCALAADKPFAVATREQHERSGRAACGVCRP